MFSLKSASGNPVDSHQGCQKEHDGWKSSHGLCRPDKAQPNPHEGFVQGEHRQVARVLLKRPLGGERQDVDHTRLIKAEGVTQPEEQDEQNGADAIEAKAFR